MSGYEIVVVGTSSGGLAAVARLLGALPASFPLPIAIVQHRAKESDETLAAVLQRASELPVREVEDKDPVAPGVYLAPADYHLLLEPGSFALSVDELVGYSRPSIDVLFESAADSYGAGVIGALLTGANQDGTRGLAAIKAAGGRVLVQDPASAESPTMPASAIASIEVDHVGTIEQLAAALVDLARGRCYEKGAKRPREGAKPRYA